jgi:hypothetical protein
LARELKPEEISPFIEDSVHSLLLKLYADLETCEEKLSCSEKICSLTVSSDIVAKDYTASAQTPKTLVMGHEDEFFVQDQFVGSTKLLDWMKEIYFQDDVSQPCRIVGPVGERPLHVCFLRANEFQLKSEKDIRNGILAGARKYIDSKGSEAVTPYGKDYCAAVGNRVVFQKKKKIKSLWTNSSALSPPFYKFLSDWANQTFCPAKEDCDSFYRERAYDSEKLVTTGLYEGETVLYFSITSKDLESVEWLLKLGGK